MTIPPLCRQYRKSRFVVRAYVYKFYNMSRFVDIFILARFTLTCHNLRKYLLQVRFTLMIWKTKISRTNLGTCRQSIHYVLVKIFVATRAWIPRYWIHDKDIRLLICIKFKRKKKGLKYFLGVQLLLLRINQILIFFSEMDTARVNSAW